MSALLEELATRVVVADGATGTMLQAQDPTLLFEADAYRGYLELHGPSVQLAEALAGYWPARVPAELGVHGSDPAGLDGMLRTDYQGCRYSLGCPACPNLDDRAKIADLLRPERIGVHLPEELQLHPEQSTDAIIVRHPEASHFNAGGRS